MRLYVSVSIAESKVSRRYDTIPSATLHPNADEINYLRRLVCYSVISLTFSLNLSEKELLITDQLKTK